MVLRGKVDWRMSSWRSCWECNGAHEYLKQAKGLFWCFICGRIFKGGRFLGSVGMYFVSLVSG